MKQDDDRVTEVNGRRFRKEVVSPTYTRYVPVDDPLWLYRAVYEWEVSLGDG